MGASRPELGDVEEERPAPPGLTNGQRRAPPSSASRRRSSSATQSATWSCWPRRTSGRGRAGDLHRRGRVVDVRPADVLDCRAGPTTQPTRQPIILCSFDTEPTTTVARPCPRSGAGGSAAGRRRGSAPSPRRRRARGRARGRGRRRAAILLRRRCLRTASTGSRAPGRRPLPDGGGERVPVEPPLALDDAERHAWDAAGEVDAVDDAGVGRVGDDHLVARSTVTSSVSRIPSRPPR